MHPAQRMARDIPPDEKAALLRSFAPTARRYRWHARINFVLITVALGSIWSAFLIPSWQLNCRLPLFFTCCILAAINFVCISRIRCPNCNSPIVRGRSIPPLHCEDCGLEFSRADRQPPPAEFFDPEIPPKRFDL
jgi:hypothetical protein